MSRLWIGERAPWGDFPPVIRNGGLGTLKSEPEYRAAKSGDARAALELVGRLLTDNTVQHIKQQIGDQKPWILPVLAVEAAGNNKIPLAMAEVLADRLRLKVESNIVQSERVGRTGKGADHRLAFNPSFEGEVKTGQAYLILDDNVTMGGTLASLRGYIENRGGKVVAATVMTARELMVQLPVTPKILAAIEHKHGPLLNQFWREKFGYGIDKLTRFEAGHLRRAASFDQIRDRLATARHERISRLAKGETQTTPRSERGESAKRTEVSSALEQDYRETLGSYVLAKYEQADRIEDRLEHIIDRQKARLQQRHSARQEVRLNRLRARLGTVRGNQGGNRAAWVTY